MNIESHDDDTPVVHFDVPRTNEPCLTLWLAVLAQAKADLMANVPPPEVHAHNQYCARDCQKLKYTQNQIAKESAFDWFTSTSDAPHSFVWVCSLINIDPRVARAAILGRYEQMEQLREQTSRLRKKSRVAA